MANQFTDNKGNSTLGMALLYAKASSVGAITKWKRVPDVKQLPSLSSEPNTIDTTTLAETVQETAIAGLKSSQVLEVTANFTDKLERCWNNDVCASLGSNQHLYFCWYHPTLAKASVFEGDPTPLDFGDVEVNGVLETSLYIAMASGSSRVTKPTSSNILEFEDVSLSAITVGTLTLSPTFNKNNTNYTTTTTSSSVAVSATASDTNATIEIKNGTTTVTSGGNASLSNGENTLTFKVTNGSSVRTYTVVVTKSA